MVNIGKMLILEKVCNLVVVGLIIINNNSDLGEEEWLGYGSSLTLLL